MLARLLQTPLPLHYDHLRLLKTMKTSCKKITGIQHLTTLESDLTEFISKMMNLIIRHFHLDHRSKQDNLENLNRHFLLDLIAWLLPSNANPHQ
jgi:hypothetical protein